MTLEIRDVAVRTRRTLSPASLRNVNIRVGTEDRLALLGTATSGLRLIVDVICGKNAPDSGYVVRGSSVSWPLPGGSFLHKHLNFVANARFIAQLYEADEASFIARVIEMAGIEEIARERLDHCPKTALSSFSFALGACLPFDIYFFTSTGIGDKKDREKFARIISDLGKRSGLLMAAASGKSVQPYCDKAFVFDRGRAIYYDDMDAALEHLGRIAKPTEEPDEDETLPGEDERVLDDF